MLWSCDAKASNSNCLLENKVVTFICFGEYIAEYYIAQFTLFFCNTCSLYFKLCNRMNLLIERSLFLCVFSEGVFRCPEDQQALDYAKVCKL